MNHRIPGEIEVIASPYCPPGRVFLIQTPIRFELSPLPPLSLIEPGHDDFVDAFRYGFEMRIPKPPAFLMLTNLHERRTGRQIWHDLMAMSARRKARRQRRLDYRSNVRRRKRRAELARRRKHP